MGGSWLAQPGNEYASNQNDVERRSKVPSYNRVSAAASFSRPTSVSDLGPRLLGPSLGSMRIGTPNSPFGVDVRDGLRNVGNDAWRFRRQSLPQLQDHPVVTTAARHFRHMLALLESDDDQQLCS